MKQEIILDLLNRAATNNVNGYDVVEALRLASPLFDDNTIDEINSILEWAANERGLKPGQNKEPDYFIKSSLTK